MELKIVVITEMSLIHRISGKEFVIDKKIEKVYNGDSAEYEELVEQYTEQIGFKREENEDKFDKELLKILSSIMKQETLNSVDEIIKTVKSVYCQGAKGWIEFGSYVLNIQDFSGVSVSKFDVQLSKH